MENDHTEHNRQNKQSCHDDDIDLAEILEAHDDPQGDESTDNDTPPGHADGCDGVGSQSCTAYHDGRPADKLDDVQTGEELGTLRTKGDAHRFHGTASRPAADEAGQVHDDAAYDMTEDNRFQGPGKA